MLKEAARVPTAKELELEKDMAESFAYMKGETKKLTRFKTTRYELPLDADEVKALRKSLDLSQGQFAGLVNASPRSIQGWEQGQRRPDGSTSLLLWLLKQHPEQVVGWLKERKNVVNEKAPAKVHA